LYYRARQSNLLITLPFNKATMQVDNLDVAQFTNLLMSNDRMRHVIDTITSKVVLILGPIREGRKLVLDAIRNELRKRGYLPVLFDFQKSTGEPLTGTITTLANMARFIIADLADLSTWGLPHELASTVPTTPVGLQTIFQNGQEEYAMFADLKKISVGFESLPIRQAGNALEQFGCQGDRPGRSQGKSTLAEVKAFRLSVT
jgi:hypothetical protein